jgi:8-oxo-dGTP pyrophosphatase MutT (NUDIX family)
VLFDELQSRLRAALAEPLPGARGQALMAPRQVRAWPPGVDPDSARHAAGLLLVVPEADRATVILTVRSDSVARHRGQVSLPGGVVEPGESFPEAALREAHEEIGLEPDALSVLGPLSPLDIPVSGFRLHPIVATARPRPELRPSDGEVARILDVAVADLFDPSRVVWRTMRRDVGPLDYPAFSVDGVEIWGATAMVLAEFLAILGWAGPEPLRRTASVR